MLPKNEQEYARETLQAEETQTSTNQGCEVLRKRLLAEGAFPGGHGCVAQGIRGLAFQAVSLC